MNLREKHAKFIHQVLSEASGSARNKNLKARILSALEILAPKPPSYPKLEDQSEGVQLTLLLELRKRLGPGVQRRGRRRWAKYPFEMVEEARQIRYACTESPFSYQEIAKVINKKYGTNIHWVTIRDWTGNYYRVTG